MFLKSLIICLLFSLTLAHMPRAKPHRDGVVGGRDPKAGEVKYIVAIHSGIYMCGGGIIGAKFILTAAHCVNIDPNTHKLQKPMEIVAGTNVAYNYNRAGVIEIKVTRAFLPSVYHEGTLDDIAVLELEKELDFIKYHKKIQKLNLPEPLPNDPSKYSNYEHKIVKFAGYGNTRADIVQVNGKYEIQRSGAGGLKVAEAAITGVEFCKRFFNESGSNPMCLSVIEDRTGQFPQGTCTGDSGSPAVYNNDVVIGLDSTGIFCNNNWAPTLFTRVSAYIPFIKKAMNGDTEGLVVYEA